ncbi:MAG: hypothetical protein JO089_06990 [Alphaproteobacteria bacterium]|nr:hypothetical protein [Alphaproteobacteria bacterium]
MKRSDGYIIEYYAIGKQVKVTAIDPETGREASIIGAPAAGKDKLAALAIRKLTYVQQKDKGE